MVQRSTLANVQSKKIRRIDNLSHRKATALGFYLALLAAGELAVTFGLARTGLWIHAAAALTCIVSFSLSNDSWHQSLWASLGLAPLIRIISLSLPLAAMSRDWGFLLTGIPVLLGAGVIIWQGPVRFRELFFPVKTLEGELLVAASGLVLGYMEFSILKPKAIISDANLLGVLSTIAILLIFTGLMEELVFRGLMQSFMTRLLGGWGIPFVALTFAILHIGYRSLPDLIFVFLVALYFGYWVRRSGSLIGVSLAHGLINVALFLIFPNLTLPH